MCLIILGEAAQLRLTPDRPDLHEEVGLVTGVE